MPIPRRSFTAGLAAAPLTPSMAAGQQADIVDVGGQRELLVDTHVVDQLRGAELRLATPVDAGPAMQLNQPWEGAFSGYSTVMQDANRFLLTYRGVPEAGRDGNQREVTCCAESADGITWKRPSLSFHDVGGVRPNNVILAGQPPFSHNFTPLLDTRPGVRTEKRFKAIAGTHRTGLQTFASGDGIRWRTLTPAPLFPIPKEHAFDSQNLAFWSEHERCYVLYFRTWKRIDGTNYRWVSRCTSTDFVRWSPPEEMDFGRAPAEHLYTNQASPYFRAPQIYVGICARFFPGRQVLSAEQAAALSVDPGYFKDCSDAVLITSRGGNRFQRHFLEAFLRPGLGIENWVSRSNYPALNVVQTGPRTMSFYVNRNYGQPTAYLRRYELRLDGFASLHAGYRGGECVTRPMRFTGDLLYLNFSTSAAGSVRVEVQDAAGTPLPGYTLSDARELIGDEIERPVAWHGRQSLAALNGQLVRIRFVLKDADVYAFRFGSRT